MPRNVFNTEMDQVLMDEIILANPFKYGITWDMILENLGKSSAAALFQGITKSKTLRDHALLIMGKRRAFVAKQLSSSGLEEPPRTDLDLALDEAIQLEDDSKIAQRMTQEERRERIQVQASAAETIVHAAFTGRGPRAGTGVHAEPAILDDQTADTSNDAEEAAPLEADQEGSRKAGPSADGPRVKRRKSDLMTVMEMQEAMSEARQATLLQTQARWRQVDSTAKMELANQQMEFRFKELEQRKVEKEREHQLQRDRLDIEKNQREEEKKQREEEKKQREEEKKQREEEKKQREEEEKKQREEEKKHREEEKKQREEEMRLRGEEIRLRDEEMRQRVEENRIRALESQNQREALIKMLELLASKK